MKEHPIIFSGPMVRAIIEGRKTQTRRVCKVPSITPGNTDTMRSIAECCPYGQSGDLLWVRETFAKRYKDAERDPADGIIYRADGGCVVQPRWTPAIHMPRWASRLTLRIEAVRVQRLQEITEEDARAEGIDVFKLPVWFDTWQVPGYPPIPSRRVAFSSLWDNINEARGYPWASNTYVYAITFRRESCAS